MGLPKGRKVPSRHPPQRLIAPVRVPFALEQRATRMLDGLALERAGMDWGDEEREERFFLSIEGRRRAWDEFFCI